MDEARTWDALARRYDTIVRAFDRSYPAIRRLLAEDLDGKARVLEVAAGTGQFTLELARVADTVVATDISPQMVEHLEAFLRDKALTNVQARVMSAYELDAQDGSFDAVYCANALHVMEEPRRALGEFRRVLVEDGLLIAPTFLHGASRMRRVFSQALSLVSPFVAHSRFDLAGLCELIESEGFVIERSDTLPGLFPVGYVVARRAP